MVLADITLVCCLPKCTEMKLLRLWHSKRPQNQKPLFYTVKEITGLAPKNLSLYKCVFTHTSMEETDESGKKINYERLEFLAMLC